MLAFRVTYATALALLLLVGFLSLPSVHARPSTSGPRTWHVLVGAQSEDLAIQADAYYPHVITIDVGDTVVWTLNAAEPHSVTFFGTCTDLVHLSCFQPSLIPCLISGALDFIPCSLPTYDGIGLASSGRMIPSGFNWNSSVPNGGTMYGLTFTNPGVDIYFDVSALGMRGIVIVNPASTPYPFTQDQYNIQGKNELRADLAAGTETLESFKPPTATSGPDGTLVHHVTAGLNTPQKTKTFLHPTSGSHVIGTTSLVGVPNGLVENLTATVRLSGLVPGHAYTTSILLGVCDNQAPSGEFLGLPTFTLNTIRAGPDGKGSSTTLLTASSSLNAGSILRIPSNGWFVSTKDASSAGGAELACGNVDFHNISVMRFLPQNIGVNVGDTVVWTDDPNGVHSVTFLAGRFLPLIPDYTRTTPTGNATSYDGKGFFDSGRLIPGNSFELTFTNPGIFPYVDVFLSTAGMKGTVVVGSNQDQGFDGAD